MRRLVRGIGYGLSAIALGMIVLAGATARTADPALWPPKPGAPTIEVFVVSHGYHAGLAFDTAQLADAAGRDGNAALIAVTQRFAAYPFIEIGFGEERFYASVPNAAAFDFGLAIRALFHPGNPTVMHVVGLPAAPRQVFPSSDIVRVPLSEPGFARLRAALDRDFARHGEPPLPQAIGKGLYGPSLFFRASGSFHIFNVCNHWVSDMLSAAGLPVTPVLDTVPPGLLLDLKWRAGLDSLPGTHP
ncbi:MAG: DUF2459 domain-containing protein [Pseudorhodoplanes sp.]|uniref:DUF2459 domain-containing protein n=1 Tax=Pseudorhodoplanes sp. TaxID=1934341 RepID=UPI003D10B0F2